MPQKPLRRKVVIPETGRVVSLAKAREAMVRREAWLGIPPGEMRRKLSKQLTEFESLANVVDAYNRTKSYSAAGRAGGVSRKTAKTWVEGKKLPRNVSQERASYYLRMRKPLRIKASRAGDFAYVLGAMMGNASRVRVLPDSKHSRVNLGVRNKKFAQAFARKLRAATGLQTTVSTRVSKGAKYHVVDFGSMNLLQLFNEATDYSAHVPMPLDKKSPMRRMLSRSKSPVSFLDSKQARRQFAKALYDSRGYVHVSGPSKTKAIIINPLNPELKKFISVVLLENGMHPREWKNGAIVLPSTETQLFMRTIGFHKKVAA